MNKRSSWKSQQTIQTSVKGVKQTAHNPADNQIMVA